MILLEETQLSSGIFWIKDIDNISDSNLYFTIPVTSLGDKLLDVDYNSKNGETYNHKNTWEKLPSNITENKPFDYYPRGRVEIRNNKATIFCSPYIYSEELKNWCIDKFNLTKPNGITSVRLCADNSNHYHCYLDEN